MIVVHVSIAQITIYLVIGKTHLHAMRALHMDSAFAITILTVKGYYYDKLINQTNRIGVHQNC